MLRILLILWVITFFPIYPFSNASQTYNLTLFGIKCGEVVMEHPATDQISFNTKSTGIIDFLWPFDNYYKTRFDTVSFGLRSYEKKIHQGTFKQKLIGTWDEEENSIIYNDSALKRSPDCQTIFTILARSIRQTATELDTKWFPLEHEGRLFKTRLLRSDTVRIVVGKDSILCDYYRLDLIPQEEGIEILERTDYFNEYIIHPDAVKQLWVEINGERRIIQASVHLYGLTIKATIVP